MELTVRRLGVLSLGKIMGALYGLFGLIFGALFSLFSVLGLFAGLAANDGGGGEEAIFGLVFGAGAIIVLPIFYGVFGFVGGLLTALLFNLVSGIAGGLQMEVQGLPEGPALGGSGDRTPLPPTAPTAP